MDMALVLIYFFSINLFRSGRFGNLDMMEIVLRLFFVQYQSQFFLHIYILVEVMFHHLQGRVLNFVFFFTVVFRFINSSYDLVYIFV